MCIRDRMWDDGAVIYLNGHEIGRASMPTGTITAATLSTGHEAGNAYVAYDWSAQKSWLVTGVNTVAVEVHQSAASSSDLVFDLSLSLSMAQPPPRQIARGSTWRYWDRGGDLGTLWHDGYDDSGWSTGAGPLGYGESYLATTIG